MARLIAASCMLLAVTGAAAASAPFTPRIVEPSATTPIRRFPDGSTPPAHVQASANLFGIEAGYDSPILLANISASDHYSAGYAYAVLLANETVANFEALLKAVVPKPLEQWALTAFMAWQYSSYVQPHLPQQWKDEMQGYVDGAASIGMPQVGKYVQMGVALSSIATGDVTKDILYLLEHELFHHATLQAHLRERTAADGDGDSGSGSGISRDAALRELAEGVARSPLLRRGVGRTCSMFGVWGPRTADGRVRTGRNLDWEADTGLATNKLVTVYKIGGMASKAPYATVGFAGMVGAIAGMSAAGITTHEAGDDNTMETLEGFAWALRMRAVMEAATDLKEARAFWAATNNTLGINHGIGSAAAGDVASPFMVLETKAGYTAEFGADDPREAGYSVNGTRYGFAMPHALWRTNHGYDPKFLATAMEGPVPGHDSQTRYELLRDTFDLYGASGGAVDDLQAVNLTAVVGDKGGSDRASFVTCAGPQAVQGENIVSVAFAPAKATWYVAFENGRGAAHVPACCMPYVKLDMTAWFAQA